MKWTTEELKDEERKEKIRKEWMEGMGKGDLYKRIVRGKPVEEEVKELPKKSPRPIRNQSSQKYGQELHRRLQNGDKSVLEYMSIHRELVTTKIKIRKTNAKIFQDWEKEYNYSQSFSDYSGYSFEEHLKRDTDEIRKELNDLTGYLKLKGIFI